jgi:phosphoglycolate phosphatase-like HAD superfamily hydrolase
VAAHKLDRVIRHIVWDWNGTLFDDQDLVVATTNFSLRSIGIDRETTYAEYRLQYRRPLSEFYRLIAGRAVGDHEWVLLDAAFGQYYDSHRSEYNLHRDALAAMDAWAPRGQSLLSMYGHDKLTEHLGELGITARFSLIDGRPPALDLGPKAKYLAAHMMRLRAADPTLEPDQVAIVGDCIDDAQAALGNGATAVLFSGGTTDRAVLEAAGLPVVDTLIEAVNVLSAL